MMSSNGSDRTRTLEDRSEDLIRLEVSLTLRITEMKNLFTFTLRRKIYNKTSLTAWRIGEKLLKTLEKFPVKEFYWYDVASNFIASLIKVWSGSNRSCSSKRLRYFFATFHVLSKTFTTLKWIDSPFGTDNNLNNFVQTNSCFSLGQLYVV